MINFPEGNFDWRKVVESLLRQMQGDLQRMLKRAAPMENPGVSVGAGLLATPTNENDPNNPSQQRVWALGKTGSLIDKGSSGSIDIYADSGSGEVPTGETIVARNKFGKVQAGKFVGITKDITKNIWYITSAEC